MSRFPIAIRPFGEKAVLIEWPKAVDEGILDDILRFSNHLGNNCLEPEQWEFVQAYNSIVLIQRKEIRDFGLMKRNLLEWYSQAADAPIPQKYLWRLPVCYDSVFGIDLDEVAKTMGRTVWDIIALHTKQPYTVYGIGFLPGFMYLGGLPHELEIPRKKAPRLKVQAGAVGLAGKQTGIYPQESPGGWNIIGNCPIPIFDASKKEPCFVRVGDRIRFYGINRKEHELYTIQAEVGIFNIEKIKWDD